MAKILIIDDDPSVRSVIEMVLQRAGHTVTTAANGSTALEVLGHELVITDIEMPGMSGFDVCRAIRANPSFAKIPVILMTGRPNEDILSLANLAGVDHIIYKPFDRQSLLALVAKLLSRIDK